MFDTHLIPGRKKVHGRNVMFDLTLSGLQVGPNVPLRSLSAITRYLRRDQGETERRKILDFGAGRLRNTSVLASSRSLEVWFTEFNAVHSHGLARQDLKNARGLAERFNRARDRPSMYLREKLRERTRKLIEKLAPRDSASKILVGLMLEDLNLVLWEDKSLFSEGGFRKKKLPEDVKALVSAGPAARSTGLLRLNRYLLELAYPSIIAESFRNHVYPHELPNAPEKFDAILLSYVLHTLPHADNREEVLAVCSNKLKKGGLLVVASPKYNSPIHQTLVPGDEYDIGWVRGIKKSYQTFYSEPSPEDLIEVIERFGFEYPTEPKPLRWVQSTAHVLGFIRS